MRSPNDRIEYVYIIGEHDLKTDDYTGYYKIGKSFCPEGRIDELQRANVRDLSIRYKLPCKTGYRIRDRGFTATDRENQFHQMFSDYRVRQSGCGKEWFDFRKLGIENVISQIEEFIL